MFKKVADRHVELSLVSALFVAVGDDQVTYCRSLLARYFLCFGDFVGHHIQYTYDRINEMSLVSALFCVSGVLNCCNLGQLYY
jgi:hypothetical protein